MSFADEQFKGGAYYRDAPAGEEQDYLLPWKIAWDPSRGSDSYSREVIRIDTSAEEVSGQDPSTYERFYNPTIAEAVVPLRHTLFDASPSHPIRVWTLNHAGTSWQEVGNPVGVEGVDATGVFFARRDIPLSGDVGFTVGRMLFLGNETLNWPNIAYIRIEILYLGDYVKSESFDQDLHPLANVVHRTLEVDVRGSTQNQYNYLTTSRHTKLYRDLESSFLHGVPKTTTGEHSQAILDQVSTYSLRATDPAIRFGIHDTVYASIDPQDTGQAHAGTWPTGSDYFFIDKADNTRNTDNLNFILSHLQTGPGDEHSNEVALQYDADEMTWQLGGAYDSFRREYTEAVTPSLARRYPIVARFAQGRLDRTNTGWVGSSNGPDRFLQEASGRTALVTTYAGDPTLLQVHPDTDFVVDDGDIYLRGMTQLRLYAPEYSLEEGRLVDWRVSASDITKMIGDSGTRRVQNIDTQLVVAPGAVSTANMTRVRWQMEASATTPVYRLQIDPAAADGVYGGAGYHDLIRIGLRGHGTSIAAKYLHIGAPDPAGITWFDVEREELSSFDMVFASHMLPRVRGNMIVEGILDTYSDFAIGRDRSTSGSYNDTFGRNAMIRGKVDIDTLELNKTTSGYLNVKGNTLIRRRLSGPTTYRMDDQLRRILGWETILGSQTADRSFEPHRLADQLSASSDNVDGQEEILLGVSSTSGKVDAWSFAYIEYLYDNGVITQVDHTNDFVPGYLNDEDRDSSTKVISGYARGQLHREGKTARGVYGVEVPVIMDRAGVPEEGEPHAGDPQYHLNSSDMYLDADGRWRYLFDKVYLPVDNN